MMHGVQSLEHSGLMREDKYEFHRKSFEAL
jgi:hypothetical protein